MCSSLSRFVSFAAAVMLGAIFLAGPVIAETKQPAAPMPGGVPSEQRVEAPFAGSVEGAPSRVDPAAGTVRVASGLFGLIGKTLEVTTDTKIQVQGREGSLADLREGAKVKASYESREGNDVATQIDVMPPAASDRQPK